MKIHCISCGCHFPAEFEDTLNSKCELWQSHNGKKLPIEAKKKVWDWIFSFNSDEFFIKYDINMAFNFSFVKVPPKQQFKNLVPNWEKLSEKEQQEIEKQHFKDSFDIQAGKKRVRFA